MNGFVFRFVLGRSAWSIYNVRWWREHHEYGQARYVPRMGPGPAPGAGRRPGSDQYAIMGHGHRAQDPRRPGEDAHRRPPGRRGAPGRGPAREARGDHRGARSEEHTSELQSLMRISYAVLCLKKK